ncbi:FxSxx-COOH system tetratricopeptide repeat protein [Streptomyces sp. YIM S03343]
MSTPGRQTKIITFASTKAGVGRTMALANIAWIMASQGKSVLTVDWDLEDPSLHRYYSQYLPSRDLSTSDGLLEMFAAFAAEATSQERGAENLRALHAQHTHFNRYDVDVHYEFPNGGQLCYLGPGRQDRTYRRRLHDFDWDRFRGTDDGREFLAALRSRMCGSDYDYILIDSHAGFSADAAVCTLALPDTVVIGLGLSPTAITGARDIARLVEAEPRPIAIHVLPLRVDTVMEPTRVERALSDARTALDAYLGITDEESLDAYWNDVLIPHKPRFAFGEELAVMIEDPRQQHTLLHACVKAARRITDGAVTGFDLTPKTQRDLYAAWTGQRDRDAVPLTVTVLHSPDYQLWGDWIGEQLTAAGVTVRQARPETDQADPVPGRPVAGPVTDGTESSEGLEFGPDHGLEYDCDYIVALLSRRLEGTAAGRAIASLAVGASPGDTPGAPLGGARPPKVMGLRISTARLVPHFDWPDAVNLSEEEERAAHRTLLSRFPPEVSGAPFRPAEHTRFPGRQPEVVHLPMRNTGFVGRTRQLAELREGFVFSAAEHVAPRVLYGMKGAGKRELALEYAHRFASQYDLVSWIPAGSADSIRAALRTLAQELNAAKGGARSGDDPAALLTDLRTGRYCSRWLLVFDGAPGSEVLEPFLPTTGPGHVLITSQVPTWPPGFRIQHIESLTRAESLHLLRSGLPGAELDALNRLAARFGDHPLMLNTVMAELRSYPAQTDVYIALIDRRESEAPGEVGPLYRTMDTVYRVLYERLRRQHPAAARLLDLCSFLSAEGVGMPVIESDGMIERLSRFDEHLKDTLRLGGVLHQLSVTTFAVVDPKAGRLKVHRILQDLVRGWMTPQERAETRAEVLSVLAAMVPTDLQRHEPEHRRRFAELDRHLEPSRALESDDPQVHRWLVSQVYHRRTSQRWTDARRLGERVLTRWRADPALGDSHTSVLRLETEVAAACRALGDYRRALSLSQHSVTIQRERNSQDVYTLMAARGYAADLRATGRFRDAFDEDRRTYHGLDKGFGEERNATLDAAMNLALSQFYAGTVKAAIDLERQVHWTRKRLFGKDDFRPWISYANLGTYLRELGDLADSERYLTHSCDRFRKLTGKGSDHYLSALASLGMTMVRRGDHDEGLRRLQDARAGCRQWGDRHPSTMACDLSIAIGLHASGRSSDAADSMPDLHHRYTGVYGDTHPFTSICLNNMSVYLLAAGDPETALSHARKAVYQLEKTFDAGHRYALVARMNQNNCLSTLGKDTSTEDIGIHEECAQDAAWGEGHPVTLRALANRLDSGPEEQDASWAILGGLVSERLPGGHPLAAALLADPYRRLGADLEVHGV